MADGRRGNPKGEVMTIEQIQRVFEIAREMVMDYELVDDPHAGYYGVLVSPRLMRELCDALADRSVQGDY